MKKVLTWLAVIVLVIGGGIAVFWQIDFWRLFDANLKPLVLTEAEAYCAGFNGIQHNFKYDDADIPDCIANSAKGDTPSIRNAVRWSCEGIVDAGWGGDVPYCIQIFDAQDLWMLLTGGITWEWNTAHPRPRPIDEGQLVDDGRSSTRTDTNRGDFGG